VQVDLGSVQPVRHVTVALGSTAIGAGYQVKLSSDGANWSTAATVAAGRGGRGGFGGGFGPVPPASFEMDGRARHVRIEFANNTASVRELSVYSARHEPDYYDVTYKYRLRWNDVGYEPGELKVVAYKAGAKIGEKAMRTAGAPASIRLTPDRAAVTATGEDLSFILVEAVDAQGNVAPLADNLVQFELQGPGEIAGIDNGDQVSLDPLQDNQHKLFFGKAMLIVRAREGQAGKIQVTARSQGLNAGSTTLTAVSK
jgi:hypothetical protein